MTRFGTLLVGALALCACGVETAEDLDTAGDLAAQGEALAPLVTVKFPAMATWGKLSPPTVSGTFKAGSRLRVTYDRSRILNTCYITQGDRLLYKFRANGADTVFDLGSPSAGNAVTMPDVIIPAGADRFEMHVQRWGVNKAQSGAVPCTIDGDAALKLIGATAGNGHVVANADWTLSVTSPVFRGRTVIVDYRRTLASQCAPGNVPLSAMSVEYQGDAGTARASLASGTTRFAAPRNPSRFVFWFRGDQGTCTSWDSNYGANWSLPLYWPL